MSFPFELFSFVCGFEPIEFPSKMVRCRFSLDLRNFLVLDFSLHLGSSNHELSFELFSLVCGLNQLNFLPKWCNVGLALICHFLVLDLSLDLGSPNHELSFELFSLVCGLN
jgi:hypothetical protein